MLLPDDPVWGGSHHLLDSLEILRLTRIALRFHVNSSTLWRLRSLAFSRTPTDPGQEAKFLAEVSGFKKFNYHLFSHWGSVITSANFADHHMRPLLQFIRRNPSNYSPFNVLLKGILESPSRADVLRIVLGELSEHEMILSSPAFRQFFRSLVMTHDRSLLPLLSGLSGRFPNTIAEWT